MNLGCWAKNPFSAPTGERLLPSCVYIPIQGRAKPFEGPQKAPYPYKKSLRPGIMW